MNGWRRVRFWALGVALGAAAVASAALCTRRVSPAGASGGPAALLVGLGGSRGILAEVLWYRINGLQREGRYAELGALTDYLVGLDPANIEAWAYNAWNLAYNVSHDHADAEARWRWILRAQALLERGLEANPGNPTLLRQQGWIWEHKVGGFREEAPPHDYPEENRDYRARTALLPPPAHAAALEAALGAPADWGDPALRAVDCYLRAGAAPDALRAFRGYLLDRAPTARRALFPFLFRLYAAAEPGLNLPELQGALALAAHLEAEAPGDPALRALRERARRTLTKENAP